MVCTCNGRGTCVACRLAEWLNAGHRLDPARAVVDQVRADAAAWAAKRTGEQVVDAYRAKRRAELLTAGQWVRAGAMEVRLS